MCIVRQRLQAAGLVLPAVTAPNGSYQGVIVHRGLAYVAGQLSRLDGKVISGPVEQLGEQEVALAARSSVLRALSALENAIGSLDQIEAVLRMTGFIYSGPDFGAHSRVLEPASEVLHIAFLGKGAHVRSAIGVSSLPSGGCVEVEITAALVPTFPPKPDDRPTSLFIEPGGSGAGL
ncbi:RidA family protein [Agrobacterium vitis]|uniref:RidA family protein n=2 Tax=Agrobacterium vitis TaxID=373 RepID=UPI0008732F47|nr:RidA family protein [Agrobacterium vitis]MCM2470825.1 RidA family protein [Agrobacterium vitis]MUO71225.1 RidA family protein [Agrobacterium vitis]